MLPQKNIRVICVAIIHACLAFFYFLEQGITNNSGLYSILLATLFAYRPVDGYFVHLEPDRQE